MPLKGHAVGGWAPVEREPLEVGLKVDMEPIIERLKQEFAEPFQNASLHTNTFAEMIAYGVMLVLEEMSRQGQKDGCGAILIAAPRFEEPEPEPEVDVLT
jgi:hypothetical protein